MFHLLHNKKDFPLGNLIPLRAEGLSAKSPKQFFNFGDCSFSLFRLHFSLYIVKFLYFFY